MKGRIRRFRLALVLLIGVAAAGAQIQSNSSSPLDRLSHAKIFAFGPVGYAAQTSQEEKDYRQILSQLNALVEFEKLYAEGNMQAKSYALTGIRKISPAKFNDLYASLTSSNEKVTTMQGCIVSSETLRDVADSLASSANPGR